LLWTIIASNYWTAVFKENHLSYHLEVIQGYPCHRILLNSIFRSLNNTNNFNYHLFHNFQSILSLKGCLRILQMCHMMKLIQVRTSLWISNWCILGELIVIFKQLLLAGQLQIFHFQIRIFLEILNRRKVSWRQVPLNQGSSQAQTKN